MASSGNMLTAWEGNPTYSLLDVVKNRGIQGGINGAIGQNSAYNAQAQQYLGDYISKYLNNEGAQAQRTNQQIGTLDSYYNGSMAGQLAGLRAAQQQATLNAAALATQQAQRSLNLGRLGQQGSGGSYDARMAIGAMQPIQVQAALTNAQQARSDLGYLTGLQQQGLGQAQQLANAQAAYRLAPIAAAQQVMGNNLGNLSGLAAVNNANNIFGVQQDKTLLDKMGAFSNAFGQTIMDAASTFGSVAGGMKGMGGGGGGGGGGAGGGMAPNAFGGMWSSAGAPTAGMASPAIGMPSYAAPALSSNYTLPGYPSFGMPAMAYGAMSGNAY